MHVCIHAVVRANKSNAFHYMTCFQLFNKYSKLVIHTKAFRDKCLPQAGFGVQEIAEFVVFLFSCLLLFSFFFFFKKEHKK